MHENCNCQNQEGKASIGSCEVCGLLFGDWSHKPVEYCSMCDAWICDRHLNDWPARMQAAAKKRIAMLILRIGGQR